MRTPISAPYRHAPLIPSAPTRSHPEPPPKYSRPRPHSPPGPWADNTPHNPRYIPGTEHYNRSPARYSPRNKDKPPRPYSLRTSASPSTTPNGFEKAETCHPPQEVVDRDGRIETRPAL